MKIRPVTADLFHADRQTDRHDESNSRFAILRMSLKKEGIYTNATSEEFFKEKDR